MTVLQRPTPSTNFVRGFNNATHRGIDYGWLNADPEGTQQILAAADGTVIDAYAGDGYNGGWGRRIRIDHGQGNVTAYNHMRPGGVLVSPGQRVSAGQLIGRMGSSGAADGTHLHFELYRNGVRVDPQPYFSNDLPGTSGGGSSSGGGGNATGRKFRVPNEGQYYYWQLANAVNGNYDPSQWLRGGQLLDVVEDSGQGPVRVRAADGDLVWVGTRNNPAQTEGSSSPAPAPAGNLYFDVPDGGQYYYNQYENALNGNYDPNQIMYGGSRLVVENPGTGPVKVRANDGTHVWVGTRNNPASIRRG